MLKPNLQPIRPQHHGTTQGNKQNHQNQSASAARAGAAAAEAEAFLEKIKNYVEKKQFQ